MDKFVTVKKPGTVRLVGKEDHKADRQKFRYNPYGVSRSEERTFEGWKDKKRNEKSATPMEPHRTAIEHDAV